jgi:hypothetical protein
MKLGFKQFTPYIYREKSLSPWAGTAKMALITIDPKYKSDIGIFYHELRHVQHWWIITLFLSILAGLFLPLQPALITMILSTTVYSILYQLSKSFRYWSELDCYAVQLKHYNDVSTKLPKLAEIISTKYNLNVDKEKAMDDLFKRINK